MSPYERAKIELWCAALEIFGTLIPKIIESGTTSVETNLLAAKVKATTEKTRVALKQILMDTTAGYVNALDRQTNDPEGRRL